MSLIKCRECGHAISKNAVSCPNCGCPVSTKSSGFATESTTKTNASGQAYGQTTNNEAGYNISTGQPSKIHKSGGVDIPTPQLNKNKKKKRGVLGFLIKMLIVLIILSLLGVGAYYVYKYHNDDNNNNTETTENVNPDSNDDSDSQNDKKDEKKDTDSTKQNNNPNDNQSNKSNKEILHDPAPDGGTEDNGAEGGQDITDEIP